ncbi:nitroreductase family protein [Amycolatopsis mediterranei S699]|uniref:Nitroreductase family protein n=2 Tax=Amycolatopsis mediterranei TaxID=33910 RepID=A0A0H3DI53_AMYMU|nr:nitroreductase family protein [Amycolatopsis mediterranei U32]AEK47581.1 nitroreductase family protein [Amycolatopsis mediterranei S699]AFO82282.1 nitroreductase family protein [Amycolatopsis mediterranei S699]AGT89411.1 nitroreductase family protein [Amycolatopsis mediterranei RB]
MTSIPIATLLAERWSPRAYDASAVVSPEQVRSLLEAARWAPSLGNTQPARYLVGVRGTPAFDAILATLNSGNQAWARRASLLLIGVMVTTNKKGEVPYAEYGLGLASENLVLQVVELGLIAHQMAGFSPDAVHAAFALPDDAVPKVAIAVGSPASPEVLEEDWRIEREKADRVRLPLEEFAFTDRWGKPAL